MMSQVSAGRRANPAASDVLARAERGIAVRNLPPNKGRKRKPSAYRRTLTETAFSTCFCWISKHPD